MGPGYVEDRCRNQLQSACGIAAAADCITTGVSLNYVDGEDIQPDIVIDTDCQDAVAYEANGTATCNWECSPPQPSCDYTSSIACAGHCCGTCVNSGPNCFNCDSFGCDSGDDGDGEDQQCTGNGNGDTPVVISLEDAAYDFTDWSDGVVFDLHGDGIPELTSWTTRRSDDAFLVLDRNGNGSIDDYSELFGNWTEQPLSSSPNGFVALALFDNKEWGGNLDGVISDDDLVYTSLQLWLDRNHNGRSERGELGPLSDHVLAIDLSYSLQRLLDRHGNQLRYRTEIRFVDGRVGTAYDVIFVPAP